MRKRGRHFAGKGRCDPGAWLRAVGMQQPLTDDQLRDLGVAVHMSIERMRLGMGIELDFHTLAAAVNVSLILCERGVGAEHLPIVYAAQDALIEILGRNRRTGKWGCSGGNLQALNEAVKLHEAQIASVARVECRDALLEARRRAARGQVLNEVAA